MVRMKLLDGNVDGMGWYMAVRGMGACSEGNGRGQSGGHAEGLSLTGVVGG